MSPRAGEAAPVEPSVLLEPFSDPFQHQHRPLGLGLTTSQGPIQQEYQSPSFGQREAYFPPSARGEQQNATQASGHSPAPTENKAQPPNQAAAAAAAAHSPDPATQPKQDHPAPISAPNEPSANDNDDDAAAFETLKAWRRAFEAQERTKQQQHEAEMAQRKRSQKLELDLEAKEMMALQRRRAEEREMGRLEEVRRQHEEHEGRKREMREWMDG